MVRQPFDTDDHLGDSGQSDVIPEGSGFGNPKPHHVRRNPGKGGEWVFCFFLSFHYLM